MLVGKLVAEPRAEEMNVNIVGRTILPRATSNKKINTKE